MPSKPYSDVSSGIDSVTVGIFVVSLDTSIPLTPLALSSLMASIQLTHLRYVRSIATFFSYTPSRHATSVSKVLATAAVVGSNVAGGAGLTAIAVV